MERYLVVIAAGICGGILAHKIHIPGGAVVGAMLLSGFAALLLPSGVRLPTNIGITVQIILGISLGMTFERAFLNLVLKALPLAVMSTLILLVVAILMAYIASRTGLIDFGTALFGFSPGGMSGMAILAQTEGHNTPIVAFLHLVRIFTLFTIVPLLARLYMHFNPQP